MITVAMVEDVTRTSRAAATLEERHAAVRYLRVQSETCIAFGDTTGAKLLLRVANALADGEHTKLTGAGAP